MSKKKLSVSILNRNKIRWR